jgi:hypothetical protein
MTSRLVDDKGKALYATPGPGAYPVPSSFTSTQRPPSGKRAIEPAHRASGHGVIRTTKGTFGTSASAEGAPRRRCARAPPPFLAPLLPRPVSPPARQQLPRRR